MTAVDQAPATALSTEHLSPVLGRYYQRTWVRGEGHRLWDDDGREYLDFACGIAVTVLGHKHPRVNAAIHAQVDTLMHMCNGLGFLDPVTQLADLLVETMPAGLDTVFFGNSGAEVIEGAVKLARKATGRTAIIGFTGGFHGRTYAALSLTTSNVNYRTGHGPLVPDIHIAPFPAVYRDFGGDEEAATRMALDHLERMFATEIPPSTVAAFLLEPVQGEGGFNPAPAAFLQGLRRARGQARHPAGHRRGPVGLRPDRHDVELRAGRHRAGRRDRGQGHRQRHAPGGHRVAPRAA